MVGGNYVDILYLVFLAVSQDVAMAQSEMADKEIARIVRAPFIVDAPRLIRHCSGDALDLQTTEPFLAIP